MAAALGADRRDSGDLPHCAQAQEGLITASSASDATIWAPATAAGRAGIAILRISGPAAGQVLDLLTGRPRPPPRRAVLRGLHDPASQELLDRALVLWCPGPSSYTGEDLLEIHHHGGAAVAAGLAAALHGVPGLRSAAPGEFTRRAFLAGRLDLSEAEAVADLVAAETAGQRRQALRQLEGGLGRLLMPWRETLLSTLARIEAELDFSAEEGDVGVDLLDADRPALERLAVELEGAIAQGQRAARLRRGLTVVIAGPPNVGKSSLLNHFAGSDAAIVSPWPGTTRDLVSVRMELAGVPVTMIDTAGLREAQSPIEAQGVQRARQAAAEADVLLLVGSPDVAAPGEPGQAMASGELEPSAPRLLVLNKADLCDDAVGAGNAAGAAPPGGRPPLRVSCRTGRGLAALEEALVALVRELATPEGEVAFARARQLEALCETRAALGRLLAAPQGTELVLQAEDLRHAATSLGRITGAVGVEDLLDRVFAAFCIGK